MGDLPIQVQNEILAHGKLLAQFGPSPDNFAGCRR
jgi:hypothetical protein